MDASKKLSEFHCVEAPVCSKALPVVGLSHDETISHTAILKHPRSSYDASNGLVGNGL